MAEQTNKTRASMISSASTDNGMRLLRIAIGTKNPCKIDAVTKAIKQSISTTTDSLSDVDIHVEGFAVESEVPDQPFGDVSYCCHSYTELGMIELIYDCRRILSCCLAIALLIIIVILTPLHLVPFF